VAAALASGSAGDQHHLSVEFTHPFLPSRWTATRSLNKTVPCAA
jgi:hypothetical protein